MRAYAEKLPGTVLGVFWKEFNNLVRGHSGIYVLYKDNVPHYVGKASNLPRRIRVHQRDRLKGKWDAFSFYAVRGTRYLKHLESLLLRIVEPRGARISGQLTGAENLRQELLILPPFGSLRGTSSVALRVVSLGLPASVQALTGGGPAMLVREAFQSSLLRT